jgi:hypothetical protein
MDDLGRFLFDQANMMNERLAAGIKVARQEARNDIQIMLAVYDRALRDPDAKIPTSLHLAIETLRQKYVMEPPANVQHMPR